MLWATRCGKDLSLSMSELLVTGVAGCMRGTIAYALILRSMPATPTYTENVFISTVLGVVLINAFCSGPLFPLVLRLAGVVGKHAHHSSSLSSAPSVATEHHVLNVRGYINRKWHDIDNFYFKPLLRPPVIAQAEEGSQMEVLTNTAAGMLTDTAAGSVTPGTVTLTSD